MVTQLGANLELNEIFKPLLLNPINNEKIHIFFDACHMLELCRNTLGNWKRMYDKEEKEIKWQFFKDLVTIQNEKELLATKITNRHYQNEKMKVKLVAQLYSSSNRTIEYCSKIIKLEQFNDCEAAIYFCRMINNIFDFLNTCNFLGHTEFKRPLFKEKEAFVSEFVNTAIEYLKALKTKVWDVKQKKKIFTPIVTSKRKTGFLGFIICLSSTKTLFNDVIKTGVMNFLLTYKTSQDHLEMLFSSI